MGYDHMHLRLVLLKMTRLYVQIHSVLYFPSEDAKIQRGYVQKKAAYLLLVGLCGKRR